MAFSETELREFSELTDDFSDMIMLRPLAQNPPNGEEPEHVKRARAYWNATKLRRCLKGKMRASSALEFDDFSDVAAELIANGMTQYEIDSVVRAELEQESYSRASASNVGYRI